MTVSSEGLVAVVRSCSAGLTITFNDARQRPSAIACRSSQTGWSAAPTTVSDAQMMRVACKDACEQTLPENISGFCQLPRDCTTEEFSKDSSLSSEFIQKLINYTHSKNRTITDIKNANLQTRQKNKSVKKKKNHYTESLSTTVSPLPPPRVDVCYLSDVTRYIMDAMTRPVMHSQRRPDGPRMTSRYMKYKKLHQSPLHRTSIVSFSSELDDLEPTINKRNSFEDEKLPEEITEPHEYPDLHSTNGITNIGNAQKKPRLLRSLISCHLPSGLLRMFSQTHEEDDSDVECPCSVFFVDKINAAVDEWLNEVPIHASVNVNEFVQNICRLKSDLKEDIDDDEKIKKDIIKFLGNIPLWGPSDAKDRQKFKEDLADKLTNTLTTKIRVTDKFSEIIRNWVNTLPFKKDSAVNKYKLTPFFNRKLKRIIKQTNQFNRKGVLKNAILDELLRLPIDVDISERQKLLTDYAERLAEALSLYQLTPTVRNWVAGIHFKPKPPIDKERLVSDLSDKIRNVIVVNDPTQRNPVLQKTIEEELAVLPIELEDKDKPQNIPDLVNQLLESLMFDDFGRTVKKWTESIPFRSGAFIDKDNLARGLTKKMRNQIAESRDPETLKDVVLDEIWSWPVDVPETRREDFLNIFARKLVAQALGMGDMKMGDRNGSRRVSYSAAADLTEVEREALEYLKDLPEFTKIDTDQLKRNIKNASVKPRENLDAEEKQEYLNDLRQELETKLASGVANSEQYEKRGSRGSRGSVDSSNKFGKRGSKESSSKLLSEKEDNNNKGKKRGSKDSSTKQTKNSELSREVIEEFDEDELEALKYLENNGEASKMGEGELKKAVKELAGNLKNFKGRNVSDTTLNTLMSTEVTAWLDKAKKETDNFTEDEKTAFEYLRDRPEYAGLPAAEMKEAVKELAKTVKEMKESGIKGSELDKQIEAVVDNLVDDVKDKVDDSGTIEMEVKEKLQQHTGYNLLGEGEAKRAKKEIGKITKLLQSQGYSGEELTKKVQQHIDKWLKDEQDEMNALGEDERAALLALRQLPEYATLTDDDIKTGIKEHGERRRTLREEGVSGEELEKRMNAEIDRWLSGGVDIAFTKPRKLSVNEHQALDLLRDIPDTEKLNSAEKMRGVIELGAKIKKIKADKDLVGEQLEHKMQKAAEKWGKKNKEMKENFNENEIKALSYIQKRKSFAYLSTKEVKEAAKELGNEIKHMKAEGLDDNEIDQKIQDKQNADRERRIKLQKKMLGTLQLRPEIAELDFDKIRGIKSEVTKIIEKLQALGYSGAELEEKVQDEIVKLIDNTLNELKEEDDENVVLMALQDYPEFENLTKSEIDEGTKLLSAKRKELKKQGLSGRELENEMADHVRNWIRRGKLPPPRRSILVSSPAPPTSSNDARMKALELLQNWPEFPKLTNDEKIKMVDELTRAIMDIGKKDLSPDEFNEQVQEALQHTLVLETQRYSVDVSEWLEHSEVGSLELSREEVKKLVRHLLDILWKMRQTGKTEQEIRLDMKAVIKEEFRLMFAERGKHIDSIRLTDIANKFNNHFFEQVEKSTFSERSKNDLIDSFKDDIYDWIESHAELAGMSLSNKKKDRIITNLARKVAQIKFSGTDTDMDKEMLKEIKTALDNEFVDKQITISKKDKAKLAESLHDILKSTIEDWVEITYADSFSGSSVSSKAPGDTQTLARMSYVSYMSTSSDSSSGLIGSVLLQAFNKDIRIWLESIPELASKGIYSKRHNKKIAKRLAKKLYAIETTGTNDKEVQKQMEAEIDLLLSKVLRRTSFRQRCKLSNVLLQQLVETIDRVESSTSTTTSGMSLLSLSKF